MKKVVTRWMTVCAMLAIAFSAGMAQAQDWFENFDAYDAGTEIIGQGDWDGWDSDGNAGATVSDAFALSPSKSLEILPSSDLVQTFWAPFDGQWDIIARQYIPADAVTGTQYFIALNTYSSGGDKNWSEQISFDLANDQVQPDYGGTTLDIIRDEWVEIRLAVDLNANLVDTYYNDTLFSTHTWYGDAGMQAIQAIDLYGDGASSIYYDDFAVRQVQTRYWDGAGWTGGAPNGDTNAVVRGGTLRLNDALTARSFTVDPAGTLQIVDGGSLTVNGRIAGAVAMEDGSVFSAAQGSIDRLTTVGNTSLSSATTLQVAEFAESGTGTFTKQGIGTITLGTDKVTAPSTVFKVAEGTLAVAGADPLGGSPQVELAGGTLAIGPPIVGYVPGLAFGVVPGEDNETDFPMVSTITVFLDETEMDIPVQTTHVFTGRFYDMDGFVSFAENIDDHAFLRIDGEVVINDSSYVNSSEAFMQLPDNPDLEPGWHTIEFRASNGTGPGGAYAIPGFGMDASGGVFFDHPMDPGNGSLFQGPQHGEINLTTPLLVTADSTLELRSADPVTVGTTTLKQGTLRTTAATGGILFSQGIQIDPLASAVGFDPRVETTFGTIFNNSKQENLVISKAGPMTWDLQSAPVGSAGTSNVTWRVEEGTLKVAGESALGGRPVVLDGGTLLIEPDTMALDGHSISVNFVQADGGATTIEWFETAGAVPRGYWNNGPLANSGTEAGITGPVPGSLVDELGNAEGTTFSFSANTSWTTDYATTGFGSGDEKMLSGYSDATDNDTPGTYNFTDIPYDLYDVYVYVGSDGGDRYGAISVDGGTTEIFYQTLGNDNPFYATGYVEATATTQGEASQSNYVHFENLAGDLFVQNDRKDTNCGVHGIQIVEQVISAVADMSNTDITVTADSVLKPISAAPVPFGSLTLAGGTMTAQGSAMSFTSTTVDVDPASGPSSLGLEAGINAQADLTLGPLTMKSGSLMTSGRAISFDRTTIAETATAVGFNPIGETNYGVIMIESPEVTISKTGPSTWALEAAPENVANVATWSIEGGTLEITGSAPLGGRPVTLAGGELLIGNAGAVPIPVENFSFELPGGDKIATGFAGIPGWNDFDGENYADTGAEAAYGPTDGAWRAFFMGSDGGAWQQLSEIIAADTAYTLTVDATNDTDMQLTFGFFADDPTNVIAQQSIDGISDWAVWDEFVMSFTTDELQAGQPLGIFVDNTAGSWMGLDNVRLTATPAGVLNMIVTEVAVTEDSTLTSDMPTGVALGGLTLENGVLTTAGLGSISFTGTTVNSTTAVGLDPQIDTDYGVINITSPTAIIAKSGSSDLIMTPENVGTGFENATFRAEQGRLIGVHDGNPFGSVAGNNAALELAGGELVLTGKADATDVVYDNQLSATADSTLTAGDTLIGGSGPATITVGSAAGNNATPLTLDGISLQLKSVADHTLNLASPLAGSGGTVTMAEGNAILSGGGNVDSVQVSGGILGTTAELTVAEAIVSGGSINAGADLLTVTNHLKIGTTNYQIDDGNLFKLGGDLATGFDLTLSGGTLDIAGPPNNAAIGVNFTYDRDGGTHSNIGDAEAGYIAQTGWNDVDITNQNNTSLGPVEITGGQGESAEFSWQFTGSWRATALDGGGLAGDDNLMDGYFESTDYAGAPSRISITGLDEYAEYDVYVYLTHDEPNSGTRSGSIKLNDNPEESITVMSGTGGFAGYVLEDLGQGINVLKFEGVTGENFEILMGGPDVPNRFGPAGIQIVTATAPANIDLPGTNLVVTETSTIVLNSGATPILGDATIASDVTLTLDAPGVSFANLTAGNGATIANLMIEIRDALLIDDQAATANVDGSITLGAGAMMAVTVAGDQSSRLVVSGDMQIGTGEDPALLEVRIDPKNLFKTGTYDLVDATGEDILGTFGTVSGLGLYATGGTNGDGLQLVRAEGHILLQLTLDYDLHPGDATLDTVTDVRDFNVWNTNKFTSGTDWATGDFTGDGITDVRDFNVWNTSKFTSVADPAPSRRRTGAGGQVPEPGTLALLACGLVGLWFAPCLVIQRRPRR